jgi:hypothetical protein
MDAPEKLTAEEVGAIMEKFKSPLLRDDYHEEYFTIHLPDKVDFIPKMRFIMYDGERVGIEEYIRQRLPSEEEIGNNSEAE